MLGHHLLQRRSFELVRNGDRIGRVVSDRAAFSVFTGTGTCLFVDLYD